MNTVTPEGRGRLSVPEAAAFLGISPATLRAWIRQRRVAFYRLGRRVVFDRTDLERFLRSNRIAPRDDRDSGR